MKKRGLALLVTLSMVSAALFQAGTVFAAASDSTDAFEEEAVTDAMVDEADTQIVGSEAAIGFAGTEADVTAADGDNDAVNPGIGYEGTSKKTDIQLYFEKLRADRKASTNSNEAVVKIVGDDVKTYDMDLEDSLQGGSVSGDNIRLSLTMNKGDKVYLPGFHKSISAPEQDSTGAVTISSKGFITGKKVTGATGAVFSYVHTGSKKRIYVTVTVLDPFEKISCKVSGESLSLSKNKKLNFSFRGKGYYDIILDNIALTSRAETDKVSPGKGGINPYYDSEIDDYIYVGEDGKLHTSGYINGKGSVKIPFTAYGKKYTIKLKARK